MAQNVQLAVSGIYTAPSDYAGLPPGSLDVASNVESRHKNLLESRRGFDALLNTELIGAHWVRLFDFPIGGVDRIVGITSLGDLFYYNEGITTLVAVPGFSAGLASPNVLAKSRFIRGGQNLYITDQSGVLSLSSGSGSSVLRAGIPRGLDLTATATADSSGFFGNNQVAATTGYVASGSPNVTRILNNAGIAAGQYISGTGITQGTTILSVTSQATHANSPGTTTIGGTSISFVANPSAVAGDVVSGIGVQDGTLVTSQTGAGPFIVNIDRATFKAGTPDITLSTPFFVTMSANATATTSPANITTYSGSQVAYRMVFGRVETDIDGNTTTRLGAPSTLSVATNTRGTATNATVTGTIPKNSSSIITFVQLYRSFQTESASITPLDQMSLVFERDLIAGDFTTGSITVVDQTPDSFFGIPLYTGTDREGILQANLPPPACWDMTVFRNIGLFANCTQPATISLTLLTVGPASGLQVNDIITLVQGVTTRTYTAKAAETIASREFKIFTTGTASQNVADTLSSLIRVINHDQVMPVHAISTSSQTDLPGKFTLEADLPFGSFTATVNAHASAFDPPLTNLASEVNGSLNGVYVSKDGEIESVPGANLLLVGDSSSEILRIIALRDYVIVLKTDGIYKILGTSASNLSVIPFDLTTKVIGPDTAVKLNSGVWMLSNQGVVSVDDAGVNAKSPPIDNQLNVLIGNSLTSLVSQSFGIGYESDRKYILSTPENNASTNTSKQFVFNYVTNSWTTWDRPLHCGFIHTDEGKAYIGRSGGVANGISRERRSGTFRDFSDETISTSIVSITSPLVLVLSDVSGISAGDILFQTSEILSTIVSVNIAASSVTLQHEFTWAIASVSILKAINCVITFKQVFGDNPAFQRQFPEGIALFKETRFNNATLGFSTDFSQSLEQVSLLGTLLTGWGLFGWGSGGWGGFEAPRGIRFLIPAEKQLGSYMIPTLTIKQAWSSWKFMGMAVSWLPVSQEAGR